jgi:hypothetical protein
MNTQKKLYLLPYRCQIAGQVIAIIGLLAWVASLVLTVIHRDMDTLQLFRWHLYSLLILFVGLYLIGFSREKQEDEFTLHLRTSSALTAMLVIFGLKIVLAFVVGLLKGNADGASFKMVDNLVNDITSLGSVFFLYLIIYKIRLARFNKESKEQID